MPPALLLSRVTGNLLPLCGWRSSGTLAHLPCRSLCTLRCCRCLWFYVYCIKAIFAVNHHDHLSTGTHPSGEGVRPS